MTEPLRLLDLDSGEFKLFVPDENGIITIDAGRYSLTETYESTVELRLRAIADRLKDE